MKKLVLLFFSMLCLCNTVFGAPSFKKGDSLYVSVKSSELKSGTGRFSSTVAKVEYGDKVTVVQAGDKSTQVMLSTGESGWISTGSLTKKKIIRSADGSSVKASTEEISLAGKGFSAEAENDYKTQNASLDFSEIDEIEKITVQSNDLQVFLEEGCLNSGEQE